MRVLHTVKGVTNSGNTFQGNVQTELNIITGLVESNQYDDWEMFKDRDPSFDDLLEVENSIADSLTKIVGFKCFAQ